MEGRSLAVLSHRRAEFGDLCLERVFAFGEEQLVSAGGQRLGSGGRDCVGTQDLVGEGVFERV
jgi:hypothetical protein